LSCCFLRGKLRPLILRTSWPLDVKVSTLRRLAGRDVFIPATKEALQCWGYMQAMQDLSVLADENGRRIMGICPNEQTTLLQLTHAFAAYARHHSDDLDNDAALTVIGALKEAFPCP
jgi:hypothetical protein